VDRSIRDEILVHKPSHPNQHTYQAGKSVETVLHQLVARGEKGLDQQGIALGVFLDIEGAFNNTSYDSMCAALDVLRLPWRVAGHCDAWHLFQERCGIQRMPAGRCAVAPPMVPCCG